MDILKRVLIIGCLLAGPLLAETVFNQDDLQDAIENGETVIDFGANIVLSGMNLRPVNVDEDFTPNTDTTTINGNNFTLDGAGAFRGFFIRDAALPGPFTITNLIISNTIAQGGNGGAGGGGGAGLGGALYIPASVNVRLVNPVFANSAARGGMGANTRTTGGGGGGGFIGNGGNPDLSTNSGGGGGGGFFGNGGSVTVTGSFSGGAGGGGAGFDGNNTSSADGGDGGGNFESSSGGAGGSGGLSGDPGTFGGGGGGGGGVFSGDPGEGGSGDIGAGGGGSGSSNDSGAESADGGSGDDFGGGGGAGFPEGSGGDGGYAGGGGQGTGTDNGGPGGFGGGGGGAPMGTPGTGGFGAGNGTTFAGGGGVGFGGAVFIEEGATVTIEGSAVFSGNSAQGGSSSGNSGLGLGGDIFMRSSSELIFDITSDVAVPNGIGGDIGAGGGSQTAGGLTKRGGTSKLSLSGSSTFTGLTSVEEGEMRINGSVITEIDILAGAGLRGNFTTRRLGSNPSSGNLTNAGRMTAGENGIGTITAEGDFVQFATGTFVVNITPDPLFNRIYLIAGNATLDGTLEVITNAGNYIEGTVYDIINAPTTPTQFATIVQTGENAGIVDFQVDYGSAILTLLNTVMFVNQIIDPGPQSEVLECLLSNTTLFAGSDFADMMVIMGTLSNEELNQLLISISPMGFAALEWINARNNSYIADILSQHLFQLCCSPRDCCGCDCNTSIWASGFGNWMDNPRNYDNLRPFDATAWGVLVGIDWCCGPCFYYGLSGGYTHTDLDWDNDLSDGDINSYWGALYASWHCSCFSVDASAIGGGSDYDLKRRIVFSFIDRTAKSDPWGYFATGHLGAQAKWNCGCSYFEPFVLGDYHYFLREGFNERGAESLDLDVKSTTQHMIRVEAGLNWYLTKDCGCYCVSPYVGGSYVGEYPLHASKQEASFKKEACTMKMESYDSLNHLGSPQAGVKWTHCCGVSFIASYKGLFNHRTRINQAEGRLEWVF